MSQLQLSETLEHLKRDRRRARLALFGAVALAGLGLMGAANMARPPQVAVVDLRFLFNHHQGFKEASEEMATQVKLAEFDLKLQKEQINKLVKQLGELTPGDEGHKALDERLTKAKADLALKVELQKRKFLRRESNIYDTVYTEIVAEIEDYMDEEGLTLVIRCTTDTQPTKDPKAIAERLNRPVVAHAEQTDITPVILERLNKKHVKVKEGV